MSQPRLLTAIDSLALTLMLALFVFFGTRGDFVFGNEGPSYSRYDQLAANLLAGRVDIDGPSSGSSLPTEDEKSAASEPLPGTIRGHDRTYHRAGLFPALLIYLPILVLIGKTPPDSVVLVGLYGATALLWCLLIVRVCGVYWKGYPGLVRIGVLWAVGLGGLWPSLLSRADAWQLSLAWSQAWWAASVYFSYRASEGKPHAKRDIFLSALASGLAAGGWPTFIFLTPLAALPLVLRYRLGLRADLEELLAFAIPTVWCLALLAYYSHLRYGYWYDLGISRTLPIALSGTEWKIAFAHAGDYLMNAKDFLAVIRKQASGDIISALKVNVFPIGLVLAFPITALPLVFGFILLLRRTLIAGFQEPDLIFPVQIALPLSASALINLCFISTLPGHAWWLASSVGLPLTVFGAFSWTFCLLVVGREPGWAAVTRVIGAVSAVWSIAFGVLLACAQAVD